MNSNIIVAIFSYCKNLIFIFSCNKFLLDYVDIVIMFYFLYYLMKIKKSSPICFDVDLGKWKEWRFLLSSDRHVDNAHSDWNLQRKHLEFIKKKKWLVFDCWDLFDAMWGKRDPRSVKWDVLEQDNKPDYFNRIVQTATDLLWPYAEQIWFLGVGNHEESVMRRHEIDLMLMLHKNIRADYQKEILLWTFSGYIRLNKWDQQLVLHFDHGFGWSSPVTKGVIQSNRRAVYLPDADIVMSWHIHERNIVTLVQEKLNPSWTTRLRKQTHIAIPTYKEEFLQGFGYHRNNGRAPKPVGAWYLYVREEDGKLVYDLLNAE